MRKVCLISDPDIVKTQNSVNAFLKNHPMVYDITYHSLLIPNPMGAQVLNRVLILYEEPEEPTSTDRLVDSAYLETR